MAANPEANFLSVAPLLGHMMFAAISRLLAYPFRTVRSTALYQDVLYGAVRCMLERITIPQSRYLNASTSVRYITHCRKRNIEPKTLQVESEDGKIAAHWLGNPDADSVVLYLHGGGYTQSANEGNFQYMERLVKDLNNAKGCRSVAVLILAYTLAPEGTHPTQLREATTILSHLLTKTGRLPSDIFISGDSAGGNLSLAVLSHLLHPHPDVPPVQLEQPLGGTLLYSPWAGFRTDYPSFHNETLDMLSPLALRKWSAMFLNKANPTNPEVDPGPISGDAWTEACLNPASWWGGLHQVVDDIFVSYGSYEVLADPIKELERELKKGWADGGGDEGRVTFLEAAKAAHIAPIVDIMVPGNSTKSDTQVSIEEWYKMRLQK
ncbi:Alpha/Beta hydrolase protein [Pyrenochaeta sp. MPI-SDFR-AT-0127]|nr:Alpha/Beta hydrolase protein [Pyrenochaeta sp. MPI-SDFR-AT-0127]